MATQKSSKNRSKLRSQGLKSLITAASLAATIGGWGVLSISDVQSAANNQQAVITDGPGGGTVLPTPPAGTGDSQSGLGTNGRRSRRGGRFGQLPTTGGLSQFPTTDGSQSPMGMTRSSR